MRIILGLFLLGHALIHTGYLSRAPARTGGPEWPFEMSRSWLVTNVGLSPELIRLIGTGLVAVVVAAMLGAALAAVGIVVPQQWWRTLMLIGATASAATLIVFFHPFIVLGLLIDAALLYLVLVAGWDPIPALARG